MEYCSFYIIHAHHYCFNNLLHHLFSDDVGARCNLFHFDIRQNKEEKTETSVSCRH